MRMSVACAMRQTWMSFSCVAVAMNLPSVLHLSATWLPAQVKGRGGLAEAPNADTAIVGAGDAAAVLAEVEVGHRAGMWPEFAHLAPLDDVGVLADRRGNCPGRAVLR